MDEDCNIQCWEDEYIYTHIQAAYIQSRKCSLMVSFRVGRWHSWWKWCQFCWELSESVLYMPTRALALAVCRQIQCCAILGRNAAVCLIFTNHSCVSFYLSLHSTMPKNLHAKIRLFLEFSSRSLEQVLCFLDYSTQKPFFGYFGHIQN